MLSLLKKITRRGKSDTQRNKIPHCSINTEDLQRRYHRNFLRFVQSYFPEITQLDTDTSPRDVQSIEYAREWGEVKALFGHPMEFRRNGIEYPMVFNWVATVDGRNRRYHFVLPPILDTEQYSAWLGLVNGYTVTPRYDETVLLQLILRIMYCVHRKHFSDTLINEIVKTQRWPFEIYDEQWYSNVLELNYYKLEIP